MHTHNARLTFWIIGSTVQPLFVSGLHCVERVVCNWWQVKAAAELWIWNKMFPLVWSANLHMNSFKMYNFKLTQWKPRQRKSCVSSLPQQSTEPGSALICSPQTTFHMKFGLLNTLDHYIWICGCYPASFWQLLPSTGFSGDWKQAKREVFTAAWLNFQKQQYKAMIISLSQEKKQVYCSQTGSASIWVLSGYCMCSICPWLVVTLL